MKFLVSTSALQDQLKQIDGVIGSNTVLPILEDFLFRVNKKELTLFSTDLETSMITNLEVDSEDEGEFAIPAKMLTDTLKNLPDQPLTFDINEDNQSIEITSEHGKYKLAGESGEDFPKIPEPEQTSSITLEAQALKKAITSTVFAVGTDELRPAMTGVLFELNKDNVTFVATDAHRLVRYKRSDLNVDQPQSLIIPKKALTLLKNTLPNDDTEVEMQFNQSNAFFTFGNMKLICRLIDAQYPDYNAVIPEENPHTLTVNRTDLLNSLKRVAIFANKSTYLIRLKIEGSELTISAEDVEFSNQAQERLTCQYEGEDMEIGFNAKFLIEMLSGLKTEEVIIKLSSPTKAGVLLPTEHEDENEDILMIIMPVMLNVESSPEEQKQESEG